MKNQQIPCVGMCYMGHSIVNILILYVLLQANCISTDDHDNFQNHAAHSNRKVFSYFSSSHIVKPLCFLIIFQYKGINIV
jgi:hypothetical protein